MDCPHLGKLLEVRKCDRCGKDARGNSMKGQPTEVFACALHGECTAENRIRGITACKTCPDHPDWVEPSPVPKVIRTPRPARANRPDPGNCPHLQTARHLTTRPGALYRCHDCGQMLEITTDP